MKSLSVKLGTILAIGFIIFSTGGVWGADWKLISIAKGTGVQGGYDDYYYVEMKSIKKVSSEKVRFWYLIRATPQGSGEPSIEERQKGFKDYIELDCPKKRYRSVKSESEAREGYVLIGPIRWVNIEPDSEEEKMAEVVCRRK
jgi:hypothetical protein